MLSISRMRGMLLTGALVLSASWAQAATIEVPASGTDLQALINGASAGDTILITDSGSYEVTSGTALTIDKPIVLMASAGQNPTITNAGTLGNHNGGDVNQDCLIYVSASGAQLGSNGGGTINIDLDADAAAAGGTVYVFTLAGGEFTLDLENLYITQSHGGTSSAMMLIREEYLDVTRTINFSNVEFNPSNIDSTGTFFPLRIRSNQAFINLDSTEFHAYGDGSTGAGGAYIQGGATLNMNNSTIRGNGDHLLQIYAASTLNMTNSVAISSFMSIYQRTSSGFTGGTITASDSLLMSKHRQSLWISLGDTTVDLNRVDLIRLDFDNDSPNRSIMQSTVGTSRTITIANSNFVGIQGTPTTGLGINIDNVGGADSVTLSNNNVWLPNDGTTVTADVVANSTNLYNIDPGFATSPTLLLGDITYTDAFLKTAGTDGGPIGNDSMVQDMVPVELSTFEVM